MKAMNPAEVLEAQGQGAQLLDLRRPEEYVQGFVPGAINLQFNREDLVERLEMVLSRSTPLIVDMDPAPLAPIAGKLLADGGFQVLGHLAGGRKAWQQAGFALDSIPTWTVAELHARASDPSLQLLDVREDFEYRWGHVEGARHLCWRDVPERAGTLDRNRPLVVICADQLRSATAAGFLKQQGFERLTLVLGGTTAWQEAGYSLVKAS